MDTWEDKILWDSDDEDQTRYLIYKSKQKLLIISIIISKLFSRQCCILVLTWIMCLSQRYLLIKNLSN